MNCKKTFKFLLLIVPLIIFLTIAFVLASQCVVCHTSPRKLIQITREIAKNRPPVESKSKGPG